jgi:ActR/RegA family two-component response regulator
MWKNVKMAPQKTTLLIIDDEETVLFALKDVLSEPGLMVDTASSLDEARNYIKSTSYNGAVVDLRLGGSNDFEGFEAIKMVRQSNPGCKIILLTAYAGPGIRENAVTVGADYFMEKPASPEDIKTVFRSLGVC